jgi:signal transduction histidine kinase
MARTTERQSLSDWLRALDPRIFDAVLTVGLTMLGVLSQFAEGFSDIEEFRETDGWAVALGLLTCLPLYWRRTHPLGALLVSASAITVLACLDYLTNNLPVAVMFLTFACGAYAKRERAVLGLVAVNVALLVIYLSKPPDLDAEGLVANIALFSAGWLAGQVVRARSIASTARLAEAEERAENQRQQAARSVAEERLRLAQELHDVVAHSMSVIAVQAGMGAHVIDQRPADAKAALEAISETSRTTLQEMRRLLGVLRDEDGARATAPAPGMADLPRLVADVRRTGLPVELTVEGEATDVPDAVELSVYRLVQEGLTNVIKHAGPARAAVTVRCAPGEVEVEVLDDGRGAAAIDGHDGDVDGGHGLVGMRERVALWGGTLQAGPKSGGGYRVRATLPYGAPT